METPSGKEEMLKFERNFLKQQKENIQKVDELVNRAEMTLAAIKTEFDKYLKTSEQIMKESTKMAMKASKLEPKFIPIPPPILIPISTTQLQQKACEECYCDDTVSTTDQSMDQNNCICPPFTVDAISKYPNIIEKPSKSKKPYRGSKKSPVKSKGSPKSKNKAPIEPKESQKTCLQTIYSNSQKDMNSCRYSKQQHLCIQKMPAVEIPRALVIQRGHQITITPLMLSQTVPVVVNMGYSEVSHISNENIISSMTGPKNGEALYQSEGFVPEAKLEKEIQMLLEETEEKGVVEKMGTVEEEEKELLETLMADNELQEKMTHSSKDKEIQTVDVDAVLGSDPQMVVQEYHTVPRKYDGINRTERLKSLAINLAGFTFSKGLIL